MIDYSKMSVHDLVREYALAYDNGGTSCGPKWKDHLVALESALRKAVIREVSVAECNLDVAQGYPYVCVRGSIDTFHSLKNGEYHLVPKETS